MTESLDFVGTCNTFFQCSQPCCCACLCPSCVLDYDLDKSEHYCLQDKGAECQLGTFGCCYAAFCKGSAQGMMLDHYDEPKKSDNIPTQLAKGCCASCVYAYHKKQGHTPGQSTEMVQLNKRENPVTMQPLAAPDHHGLHEKHRMVH